MNQTVKVFGLMFMWVSMVVLSATFITAWLNPSDSILIAVNDYGEGCIECFIVTGVLVFGTWATYDELKNWVKGLSHGDNR